MQELLERNLFFSKANVLAFCLSLIILVFLGSSLTSFNALDSLAIDERSILFEFKHKVWEGSLDDDGNDAYRKIEQGRFKPIDKDKLSFSNSKYWHVLELTNHSSSAKEIVILFDNPTIDSLSIHRIEEGTPRTIASLGDKDNKVVKHQHAFPNFQFKISGNSTFKLLVGSETLGSHFLPIKAFERANFDRYKDAVYMLWGAFIGIVVLMSIYNLILFLGSGDKLYVLYIGYIVSFLMELGIVHGYNFYLMPSWLASILSQKVIALNYIISFFTVLFAVRFMKLDKFNAPQLYRFAKYLSYLLITGFLFSLLVQESIAAPLFFLAQLLMYTYVICLMWSRFKSGIKWTKFYVISWLPLLFGAAVGSMLFMGLIEYNFWTRHALLLSVMFEMAFISMALAERLRVSEAERLYQATHDPVFGLVNSNFILSKAVDLEKTGEITNFSVLTVIIQKYDSLTAYLDQEKLLILIDDFVNDIEGKLSTELRLIELDSSSRHKSTAMLREGVFSFLVASNDSALMEQVLTELSQEKSKSYHLGSANIKIDKVIGVASLKACKNGAKEIINRSLQATEVAIQNDKALWSLSSVDEQNLNEKPVVANALADIFDFDLIELQYQPKFCLRTGHVIGFSVVLKWLGKSFGHMSTEELLAAFHESALIEKVMKWVFDQSCNDLKVLQAQFNFSGNLNIKVIPTAELNADTLTSALNSLSKHSIEPNLINIEVSEKQGIQDINKIKEKLEQLKEVGFNLVADHFGTGNSSLTYLSSINFSQINIDRSIVNSCKEDGVSRAIVTACVNIAHSMGYKVQANGISDKDTLKILQSLHCDYVQGLHLGKPLSFELLIESLVNNNLNIIRSVES